MAPPITSDEEAARIVAGLRAAEGKLREALEIVHALGEIMPDGRTREVLEMAALRSGQQANALRDEAAYLSRGRS